MIHDDVFPAIPISRPELVDIQAKIDTDAPPGPPPDFINTHSMVSILVTIYTNPSTTYMYTASIL